MNANEAAQKLLENDPLTWGQFFFPHHFKKSSPRFHYELMYSAMLNQYLVVASPRESAKSTYLSFLYPFHKIVFRKQRFIVLISNTFEKASGYLDGIKMELSDNDLFKKSFPYIKLLRDAQGDTIFSQSDGFKTRFLCKGRDQIGSLRGEKFGADRPGLIILDDVEDDKMVKNPELRKELKENFDEVIGRLGHEETQIITIGTVLHDDSQLSKMLRPNEYKKYHKIIFKAHIDPDGPNEASLWPEKWTVEYLRQLRKDEPIVYAKEMQNDPVAGSNTRFKRDDFVYWRIENGRAILLSGSNVVCSYSLSECRAAIACDLAWKEKRESDSSVLMPGFITPNSEILVDTYITKKGMRPDETAENLFSMVERLERLTRSVVPVGFEKAMLENVTQWLLRREMQKRNKFLLTRELVWDADKTARIETRLQPRYAQHVIYHKSGMGDLEHQLERFPSGVHDDLPDALQGLVQLLQYPKPGAKERSEDTQFDQARDFHIKAKHGLTHRPTGRYNGRRSAQFPFPIRKTFLS